MAQKEQKSHKWIFIISLAKWISILPLQIKWQIDIYHYWTWKEQSQTSVELVKETASALRNWISINQAIISICCRLNVLPNEVLTKMNYLTQSPPERGFKAVTNNGNTLYAWSERESSA